MKQHLRLKRSRGSFVLAAAVVSLSGTSVVRAEEGGPSAPESVYPSAGVAAGTEELPTLDESSTLEDYLVYAALNNPGLRAAYDRWMAALQRVPQVKTLPDPRFTYGYFIREVETRVGPQRQKFGLSQSFPWFGTLGVRGSVATEAANSEKARYDAARLALFYRVRDTYYEYYYLFRAIDVTQSNVDLVSSLEEVLRTMYRAGETSNANLIKAQVELGTLEDRVSSLKDLLRPISARLNAALNRAADAPLPEPGGIPAAELDLSDEELFSRLAESNPELRAIDSTAAKEKASISLARKSNYPGFTVGVDYIDTEEARMPGVDDSGKDAVSAMVAVNIPIWRGKYRAAEREARARYDAAREERTDRENTLGAELEMALFEYRDAIRKIELYRDTLIPRAEQSLSVSREAFTAGNVDFLNIIDAERILLEFRLSYERALADRAQRLAKVEMLIGAESPPRAPAEPAEPRGEGDEQ